MLAPKHKLAKVGLAMDEVEEDTLLASESVQMDNKLDRVDIVGDHDLLDLVLLRFVTWLRQNLRCMSFSILTPNHHKQVVQVSSGMLIILAILVGRASINLSLESVDLGGLGLKLFEQLKELGGYSIINLTYFNLFKS